jgi:hypothetical protein
MVEGQNSVVLETALLSWIEKRSNSVIVIEYGNIRIAGVVNGRVVPGRVVAVVDQSSGQFVTPTL